MTDPDSGQAVADRHLHPATLILRLIKDAPSTLLGLPAAYAVMSGRGWGGLLFGLVLAAAALLFFQWLSWRHFRYGIGRQEMVIESGILSRTRRSIPFERIQDVDIEQGPLARLFGLAKLRIQTGGAGSDEGVLDSVSLAEAERLRVAIRAARPERRDIPAEGQPAAVPLFAMDGARLFLSGLFGFSMVYIATIFAVLQTVDRFLPVDIYDPARWIGLVDRHLHDRLTPGAIVTVALLALLLGLVTGIARSVSRDFGFRLTLEPAGVRRTRGLFTRSDVLIPRRRIQIGLVETGPVRRALGWFALSLQTLGGAGTHDVGGLQGVAPLARAGEVDRILARAADLRARDPRLLQLVSARRIPRRLIPVAALGLLVVAAGFLFPPAWIALPFLLLNAAALVWERRFHRFGIEEGLLFVQVGAWRQRQWIIPLRKIQSLRLTRTWLQRRFDLATLSIDTAGAPVMRGARIADLRAADARALADRLLG